MYVKRFKCDFVSSIQQISIKCHENKCKGKHYARYQHFTFCSFTVLNKLKPLKLRKAGLSTIKRQHSKTSDMMDRSHLNQKDMKNCKLQVCSQKVFKMSTICTDTCLEMLSSLVNCCVDNVRSETEP